MYGTLNYVDIIMQDTKRLTNLISFLQNDVTVIRHEKFNLYAMTVVLFLKSFQVFEERLHIL